MNTRTRRDVLRMLGLSLTAGGLLAACGGSDEAPTKGQSAASPQATTAAAATTAPVKPEQAALKIGYLPITDAAPLLLAHARSYYQEQGLQPERPTLLRSWAQVAEAFQSKQVDVAHILMPAAIWMRFGQNFPVKVVAWDHTDGSALTVANNVNSLDDLSGTAVAVPFWYSVHNTVLQLLFREHGLKAITKGDAKKADRTVKLTVMAPADMPVALANGSIAGYIVAEPFNAASEVNKTGKILRFTGDVWQNHACCVVIMREEDVTNKPHWAQAVITSVAQAQRFARDNRQESARLLSKAGGDYLPQPQAVIERALTHYDHAQYGPAIRHPEWNSKRIDFQPFPFPTYTAELVKLLKETVVEGDAGFLDRLDPAAAHAQLVDDRFARAAIAATGGPAAFGIPESLARQERIVV